MLVSKKLWYSIAFLLLLFLSIGMITASSRTADSQDFNSIIWTDIPHRTIEETNLRDGIRVDFQACNQQDSFIVPHDGIGRDRFTIIEIRSDTCMVEIDHELEGAYARHLCRVPLSLSTVWLQDLRFSRLDRYCTLTISDNLHSGLIETLWFGVRKFYWFFFH